MKYYLALIVDRLFIYYYRTKSKLTVCGDGPITNKLHLKCRTIVNNNKNSQAEDKADITEEYPKNKFIEITPKDDEVVGYCLDCGKPNIASVLDYNGKKEIKLKQFCDGHIHKEI